MALFDHLVVPIASEADAEATVAAVEPLLDEVDRITVLHVIEKGGGAIDKAPMEKRREDATAFLELAEEELPDRVAVETRIEFGTDVVDTIVETAEAAGGTALAFRPRGGSRIVRLLTGDTSERLITNPSIPVLSLPTEAEE